jgi:hypothetical protein
MSEALSASATFKTLQARVTTLEAGPTFTGGITAPTLTLTGGESVAGTITVGTHIAITDATTYSQFNFTSTEALTLDRTTSTLLFYIGNVIQARLSSSSFMLTGLLSVGDGNFAMNLAGGGIPTVQFDVGDFIQYNRTTNAYSFNVGSVSKATLDGSGNFSCTGSVQPSADPSFLLQMTSGNPQIICDTGDSIKYDRAANKFYFIIGNTNVASIDSSGNLKIAGTLTQSTTP